MTRKSSGTVAKRRSESFLRRLLLALSLLVVASFAHAFQPVTPEQQGARSKLSHPIIADDLEVQPELEQTTTLTTADAQHVGVAKFLQRNSGDWEMRWDRRSDRPNLIQGSGVALIPGRGNSLSLSQLGLAANETIDMAVVETRLKDFIDANSDLLKTKGLEFRLDPNSSIAYGKDNSHWFVEFTQYKEGVRVEGANLFFRIAAGNIVQFGANEVAPVAIDVQPVSTRANAFELALSELAFPAGTSVQQLIEPGELLLVPVVPAGQDANENYRGVAGSGYEHRLVWRFEFRVNDDRTTYQVLQDAHTNRVIDVKDLNEYVNATVSGGIYPTTNTDAEIVVPMPFAAVTNGGAKVTDALGIYDYSGGTATTALNGKYFMMKDDCGAISLSSTTDGNLALGTSGGTDCVTPGVGGVGNTHASRSGFYHLTNINRKAITFFPSNSWLQGKVTAEMNENDVCNAFWDGSQLNFFKSGSGCSNTGEIAAVFLHEWGHGMDTNSGGAASDQGSGEAVGDTFAFLETRDACIGKNFIPGQPCHNCTTCTGVRDVHDFGLGGTRPIAKPSNVAVVGGIRCTDYAGLGGTSCPYTTPTGVAYRGPMGYEGHCESLIASSANWDLSQALVAAHGTTGWGEMDKIWYGSLTPSKSAYRLVSGGTCNPAAVVDGCGANNWYTVYLAADDDDGNLANGTPNACRIWDAFNAHGIACGSRPVCSADSPDFTISITQASQSICAPGTTTYTVNVGSQISFSAPVTLAASGLPAGVSASFSTNPVTPGGTSTMTITATGAAVASTSTITVNGTAAASPGHAATSQLVLTTGAPAAAVLSGPANGATGTSTAPTFSWAASANTASYTLEIATDAAFGTIVQTVPNITVTSSAVSGLLPLTSYYWRVKALNACGSTTSSVFSFTTANMICRTPNLAIPDNSATGATDSLVVSDIGTLTNLKLSIKASHTYVGDLAFTLTKGSSVIVINHPTNGGGGCAGDNIDVTLDDASAVLVQSQCNASPPGLSGVVKPNAPLGTAFNGQSLAGTWTLKAVDNAALDTGTLDEWCLVPTTAAATTYTVGGNVSGLTGSGLVLSLNSGAQTLPVPASGAFTFPTGLANAAPYAVTVGTQPTGQTCSVSNGSGTIAGANVTNVSVTCAAASTFTVGGTVSGLSGSGLVLSLNAGAQTLPVAANGTFTFPTGLANAATYAVTVGTQPSSPTQTCTVSNGSGTIAGANVTNVTVACTTNTYTVGGTVSGLSGTGLSLSLGAQTLPVAANGSFTFATALASGASYAVTVGTQPSAPTQTCTVSNGSGTIAGANVTNVALACTTNTYTVGGTVSGLAGTGFTLVLGAQTLPVAANGSFTFATALASGASYAVTIGTQPSSPTQTCTLSNGSGTIASANVTNVAVSCTTNTYTVGGTVSGLSGTGLSLSLGAQTLPLSANGSFTFPTALASGASYAVTVGTQPSAPSQTCTVTNGSGTIASANVTNVTVSCTTNTYTVGGTVSGLVGNSVTLSLNSGAQTQVVAANGVFAFPTALASGAAYAVTVSVQPASPTEVCTITNGSGTVAASNVSAIVVTCIDRIFADSFGG
ncbi:MAG: proprotein convertase P-domain-containing protein [Dokdonella sp.]